MAIIFISYSHKDNDRADTLEKALKAAGHQVWRDRDAPLDRSIPKFIGDGLRLSDRIAVVVSKNSLDSDGLMAEVDACLLESPLKEKLVPLLFDQTKPAQLNPLFGPRPYVDFTAGFKRGMNELLHKLGPPEARARVSQNDLERLDFAIDLALRAGSVAMRFYISARADNRVTSDKKNPATSADDAAQKAVVEAIKAHKKYGRDELIAEEKPYSTRKVKERGYTWVIDPLDGTMNFLNGIPLFCTAIGVLRDGLPFIGVVYEPVANEVYYAIDGSPTEVWGIARGESKVLKASSIPRDLNDCIVATHISSRSSVAETLFKDNFLSKVQQNVRNIRTLGSGQLALAYVAAGRIQVFFQYSSYLWDQVAGIVLVKNSGGAVSNLSTGGSWKPDRTSDILATATKGLQSAFLKLVPSIQAE